MAGKDERFSRSSTGATPPASQEAFAESLKRRQQAAQGLEKDLLTEVPLLYGSAGGPARDPGIALAQIHREELLRRNGGGASGPSGKRSEVTLPFERIVVALVVLLFFVFHFL